MELKKIHPFDLFVILNSRPDRADVLVHRDKSWLGDEILEIDGVFYQQTTTIPPASPEGIKMLENSKAGTQ